MKTRKVSDIKADMQSIKDAIEVTTDANEKSMLEDGLNDLEKELKEAEEKPTKAKSKKHKVEKDEEDFNTQYKKAPKKIREILDTLGEDDSMNFPAIDAVNVKLAPLGYEIEYGLGGVTSLNKIKKAKKPAIKLLGKNAKTHGHFTLVSEGEAVQEVTTNLKLHKISDTVYDLHHKGKSTFEFQKKDGRWHVECKIKDRVKKEGFKNLNAAVIYVAKQVYNEDLKEYFESKKKNAARVKEFKQKHPTGETTAAQTMATAVEKIEDKLTDKVENDESIEKQKSAIVKQIIELLKMLKEIGGALSAKDKKDIEATL